MYKDHLLATTAFAAAAIAFGGARAGAEGPISRTAALCPVEVTGGQFNFIGVPLMQDAVATGAVSSSAGTAVTADALPGGDFVSEPHSLQILNGGAAGQARLITAVAGNVISVDAAFSGLEAGGIAKFKVVPHATLGSVFGNTNSEVEGMGLLTTNNSGTSDVVYVLSGGSFTAYFFREKLVFEAASAEGWRAATAGGAGDPDASAAAIPPNSAILVEKRGAGNSVLAVSGIANSNRAGAVIPEGFSAISQPFGAATTLDGTGLQAILNSTNSSGSSDLVYLMDGTGTFVPYFYRTKLVFEPASAQGWRRATAGGAGDPDEGATAIPKGAGVLIQRQAGTGSVEWIVAD